MIIILLSYTVYMITVLGEQGPTQWKSSADVIVIV